LQEKSTFWWTFSCIWTYFVRRIQFIELSKYLKRFVHGIMYPFNTYIIWPGSLALVNSEPITLRNLLMRTRNQDQNVCAR
jgi:hypothetical protein